MLRRRLFDLSFDAAPHSFLLLTTFLPRTGSQNPDWRVCSRRFWRAAICFYRVYHAPETLLLSGLASLCHPSLLLTAHDETAGPRIDFNSRITDE
jgi:hypothetical protein